MVIVRNKRKDDRPICTCSSYPFPHRVGGKCNGSAFTTFYFYNLHNLCNECNCNKGETCDVADGREHYHNAECLRDACHYAPGEYLQLEIEEPEEPEEY